MQHFILLPRKNTDNQKDFHKKLKNQGQTAPRGLQNVSEAWSVAGIFFPPLNSSKWKNGRDFVMNKSPKKCDYRHKPSESTTDFHLVRFDVIFLLLCNLIVLGGVCSLEGTQLCLSLSLGDHSWAPVPWKCSSSWNFMVVCISYLFSRSVVSDSSRPHESQHARPPCSSPTPEVYSNSCPSSRWCHPATSSSVVPFSSYFQSLPASGSFPMSQLSAWGGQSTGVSASASVLPMNTQDWSPLGWAGWISLQSKGLSRVFSNTTVQKHQFYLLVHNKLPKSLEASNNIFFPYDSVG